MVDLAERARELAQRWRKCPRGAADCKSCPSQPTATEIEKALRELVKEIEDDRHGETVWNNE